MEKWERVGSVCPAGRSSKEYTLRARSDAPMGLRMKLRPMPPPSRVNRSLITDGRLAEGTTSCSRYAAESVIAAPKPSTVWYCRVSSTVTVFADAAGSVELKLTRGWEEIRFFRSSVLRTTDTAVTLEMVYVPVAIALDTNPGAVAIALMVVLAVTLTGDEYG